MSRVILILGFVAGLFALAEQHTYQSGGRTIADPALQQQIADIAAACGVDARGLFDGTGGASIGGGEDPSAGGVELGGGGETLPPLPPENDDVTGDDQADSIAGIGKCINCHTSGEGSKKRKFGSAEEIKNAKPSKEKVEAMFGKGSFSAAEKKAILDFLGHGEKKS